MQYLPYRYYQKFLQIISLQSLKYTSINCLDIAIIIKGFSLWKNFPNKALISGEIYKYRPKSISLNLSWITKRTHFSQFPTSIKFMDTQSMKWEHSGNSWGPENHVANVCRKIYCWFFQVSKTISLGKGASFHHHQLHR